MIKNKNTVSSELHVYAQKNNLKVTDIFNKLIKADMNITYSSLYLYYTGTVIPPFEVLQELNRKLNLGFNNADLMVLFENGKQISKDDNYVNKIIYNLNTKIKPGIVDDKYRGNVDKLKMDVERRADEVFKDEALAAKFKARGDRKTSAYIAYLISKDFKDNGYIK